MDVESLETLPSFHILGVLEAYRGCLQRVQLYGPTNFAPIINHVGRFAAANKGGSTYFILLIITDGIITDMPQTKQVNTVKVVLNFLISLVDWCINLNLVSRQFINT